jgi:hypothetical protein
MSCLVRTSSWGSVWARWSRIRSIWWTRKREGSVIVRTCRMNSIESVLWCIHIRTWLVVVNSRWHRVKHHSHIYQTRSRLHSWIMTMKPWITLMYHGYQGVIRHLRVPRNTVLRDKFSKTQIWISTSRVSRSRISWITSHGFMDSKQLNQLWQTMMEITDKGIVISHLSRSQIQTCHMHRDKRWFRNSLAILWMFQDSSNSSLRCSNRSLNSSLTAMDSAMAIYLKLYNSWNLKNKE